MRSYRGVVEVTSEVEGEDGTIEEVKTVSRSSNFDIGVVEVQTVGVANA